MPDMPTGTITFLFTDIEGSTERWEHHPDTMPTALARHDALLRSVMTAHGGHVFKTVGDGICVAFADPADAVSACAGYMGHPFKKSPSDNDYYAFQVPCLRTDVLSSQHRGAYFSLKLKPLQNHGIYESANPWVK